MSRTTPPCLMALLLLSASCASQQAEPPVDVATVLLDANPETKPAAESPKSDAEEAEEEKARVGAEVEGKAAELSRLLARKMEEEPEDLTVFDGQVLSNLADLSSVGQGPDGSGSGKGGSGKGGSGTGSGSAGGHVGTAGHGSGLKPVTPAVAQEGVNTKAVGSEVISRVVAKHSAKLRVCFETALKQEPTLRGKVVVALTIAADGSVAKASTTGDMPNKNVHACVERVFTSMLFPKPEGKQPVQATFPIVFSSH